MFKIISLLKIKMDSLEEKSLDIIDQAYKLFKPNEICISFNGGKDNMIMLYLVSKYLSYQLTNDVPKCFYFKPTEEFSEMSDFINNIAISYRIPLKIYNDNIKQELFNIKDQYPNLKAIFMANRQDDPYCSNLNYLHPTDDGYPEFIRVNPILDWKYHDVWKYILDNQIPYCNLYLKGYTSIGTTKNTKLNKYLEVFKNDEIMYNQLGN